jgi:hypothetical protein
MAINDNGIAIGEVARFDYGLATNCLQEFAKKSENSFLSLAEV